MAALRLLHRALMSRLDYTCLKVPPSSNRPPGLGPTSSGNSPNKTSNSRYSSAGTLPCRSSSEPRWTSRLRGTYHLYRLWLLLRLDLNSAPKEQWCRGPTFLWLTGNNCHKKSASSNSVERWACRFVLFLASFPSLIEKINDTFQHKCRPLSSGSPLCDLKDI